MSFVRCHSVVTVDEFTAAYDAYRRHPLYRPGLPELVDFSQATDIRLNFGQTSALVTNANRHKDGRLVQTQVVMLASDRWGFATVRMFETVAQNTPGVKVTPCLTEAEALAAIGVSVATLDELLATGAFSAFEAFEVPANTVT